MKINKLLFTTTLTALALTACSPKGANSDSEIENKVEALLDKMTLEEKLGQMNQLSPWDPNELANKVRNGEIGSILNYMNPEEVNKIQKIAMEESRLGIPLLVSRDVIHGYQDHLPYSIGTGSHIQSSDSRKRSTCSCHRSFSRWYPLDFCPHDRYIT